MRLSARCLAAFLSCSFPFDYAEKEILKYVRVALLPAAQVNEKCECADSRGSPAALVALLLPPHHGVLPRKTATQCERQPSYAGANSHCLRRRETAVLAYHGPFKATLQL